MDLSKYLEKLIKALGTPLADAAKDLFANRRLAFLLAAFFVVCAGILGLWSLRRADFYQRIVETALGKRTEATPQTLKALESLILAYVETDADGREIPFTKNLEAAGISDDLKRVIEEADQALATSMPVAAKPLQISIPDTSAEAIKQQDAIVTEANDPRDDVGFLFLPARILHFPEADFAQILAGAKRVEPLVGLATSNDGKTPPSCAPGHPVCDDILFTRGMLKALYTATGITVTGSTVAGLDLKPEQVYVITENGLNRIVSGRRADSTFYRNQFRAETVFPARPYYINAFRKSELGPGRLTDAKGNGPTGSLGNYFYISQPYLDIGGNGIVVTLARAFRYPNHSDGVLCFDLKLTTDIASKLEKFADQLDGSSVEIVCDKSLDAEPQCRLKKGDRELFGGVEPTLTGLLKKSIRKSGGSEVAGSISIVKNAVEDTSGVRAGFIELLISKIIHPNSELQFIVPIRPPSLIGKDKLEYDFVAESLLVGKFLQRTAIAGATALFCLGIALTVVIASWATDARLKDDLHVALHNVAAVMMEATVPYVRLDSEDRIVECNRALGGFLGIPPDQDFLERLRHSRFEDWLADPNSRTEYTRIQNLRKAQKPVAPYTLTFRTLSGASRTARVVSSVVPASQTSTDGLPETFGILV